MDESEKVMKEALANEARILADILSLGQVDELNEFAVNSPARLADAAMEALVRLGRKPDFESKRNEYRKLMSPEAFRTWEATILPLYVAAYEKAVKKRPQ